MIDPSPVMTHLTAAGISVAVINYLKKSRYFPWITQEKTRLLRILAVVTSAIGAIGVHYTWDPAHRLLTFEIPTLAAAFSFGVVWVKSFISQEIVYQTTTKNGTASLLKEILAAVKPPVQGTNPGPKPVQ